MNATAIGSFVSDDDLRYINFFNGRLLSGEDLSAERDATRALGRHLGQAIGSGVAFGLEVSKVSNATSPQVLIQQGLAVNAEGQVLRVQCDQTLALSTPPDPSLSAECVFSDCSTIGPTAILSQEDFYVLTIAPASQSEGLAPVNGLGNDVAPCNSKYFTEGVQFRLVPLNVASVPDAAHARNWIAYQSFGRPAAGPLDFLGDTLAGTPLSYGIGSLVQPNLLTTSDVPLAILWFQGGSIVFVDCWAVRRPLTRPSATGPWEFFTAERRQHEGIAMFLQFQNQVQEILQPLKDASKIAAQDTFLFLPPLGIVPEKSNGGTKSGFDVTTFFGAHASKDVAMLDANMLYPLLRESFSHEPIDLSVPGKIQIYRIWESVPFVPGNSSTQSILVFASSALPYSGMARFGYAQWSVSRVAPSVI